MGALEEKKKEITDALIAAQSEMGRKKNDLEKSQWDFTVEDSCSKAMQQTTKAMETTNQLRTQTETSSDSLIAIILSKRREIKLKKHECETMKDNAINWYEILKGHEDKINKDSSMLLTIKDTIKPLEEATILWTDLSNDFDAILANTEEKTGIPKMLEDQNGTIKKPFKNLLTDQDTKDADTQYQNAKTALDKAVKDQKDNQDEISRLTAQLKLF